MNSQMKRIRAIKRALNEKNIDKLKEIAKKHGFINNKLRKKAWPLILGIKRSKNVISRRNSRVIEANQSHSILNSETASTDTEDSYYASLDHDDRSEEVKYDKCWYQIEKDVNRSSLNYYLQSDNISETQRLHSFASLSKILHHVFDYNNNMHYIQGFNDVVSVFYAVCGNEDLTVLLSEKVAKKLLSDFIMCGSKEISFNSLELIWKIIENSDKKLHTLFHSHSSLFQSSFALSWVLTMYAHQLKDINVAARIYDYCLSSHKLCTLYLSAALLIHLKKKLIAKVSDDVSLHIFLQNVEWDKINFDHIIEIAEKLMKKMPPNVLIGDDGEVCTPLTDDASTRTSEMDEFDDDTEYETDYTSSNASSSPVTPISPLTPGGSLLINGSKSPFDNIVTEIDFGASKFQKSVNYNVNNFQESVSSLQKNVDIFTKMLGLDEIFSMVKTPGNSNNKFRNNNNNKNKPKKGLSINIFAKRIR